MNITIHTETAYTPQARHITPIWNVGLIAASVAVSLLGAFTSTQLMCQARISRHMVATLVWTMLASLTFGFCSIWCLHFVAMLAFQLGLPIDLNIPLTVLSAILAVTFTFAALSSDMLYERYRKQKLRGYRGKRKESTSTKHRHDPHSLRERDSTELLLEAREEEENYPGEQQRDHPRDVQDANQRPVFPPSMKYSMRSSPDRNGHPPEFGRSPVSPYTDHPEIRLESTQAFALPSPLQRPQDVANEGRLSIDSDRDDTESHATSNDSDSRRGSGNSDSDTTFSGLGRFVSIRTQKKSPFSSKNPFKTTVVMLCAGLTLRNIAKGFVWSLAITFMHYLGIMSMQFDGYVRMQPFLVLLSAVISWIVCTVGCILMASMEINIARQLLFSAVASSGVATMHYTGMAATSFYTNAPVSDTRGYPTSLPIAIASIAIMTCLAANGLLVHSATVARNKLAEIVRTRKKLWAAIAQKENAEAAALARSEFIASASHEIRTPLHQLQGYSDLLDRCLLPEDARLLLFAIQDATKTLSLITNNVLDWSRLEKGEAVTRPTRLDVRSVCDSLIKLLPRRDDDADVELIVTVAPTVPKFLFIDETYLQRIAMNLVSNALKFTTTGYVFLLLDLVDMNLIITVKDTGVGIPESFLPHLFEPFKQAQTLGAERGTGLGLSIVEQLVRKVQGEIEVNSKHRDVKDVGSSKSGSSFVVTIPIQMTEACEDDEERRSISGVRQRLAFFERSHTRVLEGLTKAWDKYNVEVVRVKKFADLEADFRYVWIDIKYLQNNNELQEQLSGRSDLLVLVSYDTENTLYSVLGLVPPAHFVPIKRPWVFEHIMEAIKNAGRRPDRSDLAGRTVRFASDVDVYSNGTSGYESEPPSEPSSQPESPETQSNEFASESAPEKPAMILIVEDNKINQKLGVKMLKTLGYDSMIANDGQEAIDILIEPSNARVIDIILMDQSMPRKDGLTATREIRQLENEGSLPGADRWSNCDQRRNRRPIIAVTAVVGPSHEAMCKTVGTDAFLPKPLSLGKLRETLEQYASR